MNDTADSGKLSLKGDLSISDAENIRSYMTALLNKFDTVQINVSALEDFDSSILQLIIALFFQAKQDKKSVALEGTFSKDVRKRLFAVGLISGKDLADEIIIDQISTKIRDAS